MSDDLAQLFSDAFDEHYKVVLGFCRRYMPNIEDAADVTATTFPLNSFTYRQDGGVSC